MPKFCVTPATEGFSQAPLSMEFSEARILEWDTPVEYISFSTGSSQPSDQTWVSCIGRWWIYHLSHLGSPFTCHCSVSAQFIWLFMTPWTVVHQACLYVSFPRQEYWSGLPFLFLGDLHYPGIKPGSSTDLFLNWWADGEAGFLFYLVEKENRDVFRKINW